MNRVLLELRLRMMTEGSLTRTGKQKKRHYGTVPYNVTFFRFVTSNVEPTSSCWASVIPDGANDNVMVLDTGVFRVAIVPKVNFLPVARSRIENTNGPCTPIPSE